MLSASANAVKLGFLYIQRCQGLNGRDPDDGVSFVVGAAIGLVHIFRFKLGLPVWVDRCQREHFLVLN